ncbi:hypothetical protein [Hafnia paralvei]|uniref:hypothetical protein n=1 Tax=Hafnia paralvei TaxID=546367 RepID=UPI0010344D30|nr:hypothetical protein [Hafnia paralvei]TBL56367.1 hypothetical protein EYY97_22155 [Hafnia paralvei]
MIIYQLFRPFSYLAIKKVAGKYIYDWLIPLVFSISFTFIIYVFGPTIENVVKDGNLISKLTGFVSNLPGFYIAALAAIATFNRAEIDNLLISKSASGNGQSPYIVVKDIKNNGLPMSVAVEITRRVFLCMLFSFLTAESILIVIFSYLLTSISADIQYSPIFNLTFLFLFMFLFWQLVTATFFGLYYLGIRIHYNS